ncbi:MAG: YceI family protein [Pseudomonadota bacterium]
MRIPTKHLAAALAVSLCASPAFTAEQFKIDPEHTMVVFFVDHFGYSNVFGRFNEFAGTFTFDPENVENSAIEMTIDAASVDTNHTRRDNHLRSPDFLNSEEFPEITFASKSVEKTGDKTGKVMGDITILGTTQPITLDVTFNKIAPHPIPSYNGAIVAGFSATAQLSRSAFGMTYAEGAVGDVLDLRFEVEGIQQ